MRVLHVSSLLFNKPWFYWLACEGPRYDVTAVAGDLVSPYSRVPRLKQRQWISEWVSEFGGRLVLAPGAHDVHPSTMRADWMQPLASARVCVEGGLLESNGWRVESVPLFGGPGTEGPRHLFVRSAPPAGELIGVHRDTLVDDGCLRLSSNLRCAKHRSAAGLCGLVHQPCDWFSSALGFPCFNPGVGLWNLPQPSFIVHDLGARRSDWYPYGTYGQRRSVQHLGPS
jgi:hypothetical protein